MAGADGTQVMQTINVPKSVLIGASERPVLLTVTPKNGLNKGQKQIVVLTRSNIGTTVAKSSALLGGANSPGAGANSSPGAGAPTVNSMLLGTRLVTILLCWNFRTIYGG
jgi:hypothetical protein